MLKKIALWIPKLKNLHDERNHYASEVRRLEDEKKQLQFQIKEASPSRSKEDLSFVFSRIEDILTKIVNIDYKIDNYTMKTLRLPGLGKTDLSLSHRGIFVVGHARSGTTILLDALNSSRDVYLLGEASLYKQIENLDFSIWFNNMHRSFNNSIIKKSAYIPYLPDQDGWSVLQNISETYKFIGEKVAFRQEELGYDYASFFNFSSKYFNRSNYICVVRSPVNVTSSNINMFMDGSTSDTHLRSVYISQLQIYYLIMCLVLTLKNVFVVVHERINQDTFDYLGRELDIDLDNAGSYYDFSRTVTPVDFSQKISLDKIARVIDFHERLVHVFSAETLRPINLIDARTLSVDLYAELKSVGRLPNIGNFKKL
jgi:hypothetical protein